MQKECRNKNRIFVASITSGFCYPCLVWRYQTQEPRSQGKAGSWVLGVGRKPWLSANLKHLTFRPHRCRLYVWPSGFTDADSKVMFRCPLSVVRFLLSSFLSPGLPPYPYAGLTGERWWWIDVGLTMEGDMIMIWWHGRETWGSHCQSLWPVLFPTICMMYDNLLIFHPTRRSTEYHR